MVAIGRGFQHAFRGLWHVIRRERNARIHLVFAVAVILLGFYMRLSAAELAAVLFAIALVFFAEVMNSVVEKTLDLLHPDLDVRVRVIKDMAAAAVLVASGAAAVIGLVIFGPRLLRLL